MNFLAFAQEDTVAAVDTLSRSYSDKWQGSSGLNHANEAIQAAGSHDLIFIVLAVSLIIWFVLLFYIIRVDNKIGNLEQKIETTNQDHS